MGSKCIIGRVILFIIGVIGMTDGNRCLAQSAEEAYDESLYVPVEAGIQEEAATTGFLIDNTRTKIGRDFYELFFQQWTSIQADTNIVSPSAFSGIGEELNISVDEQPAQGISTIISITVNDLLIWQQFLQPRLGLIEILSEDASNALVSYVLNYQEIQRQLGSDDQKGSGIY